MQFSAGRAFSEAFQLLGSRFWLLFGIWVTFFVGLIAMFAAFGGLVFALLTKGTFSAASLARTEPGEAWLGGMGVSLVLFYLFYFLILFAMQLALSRASTGREGDNFAAAMGSGLRGTVPMFAVLVIYILAGGLGSYLLTQLLNAVVRATHSSILGSLMSLLLLIGWLFMFARLCLVLPLMAIEGMFNPFTAIRKAWRLTAGISLKITLLWGLVLFAALALFVIAVLATTGFQPQGSPAGPMASLALLGALIVWWLTAGLYMVTLTTALHEQLSPSTAEKTAETFA